MSLRQAAQQALEALERYSGVDQRACDAEEALRAALAEPGSDYERGFVDGMSEQAKRSVDKAVNRMAQTTHWEGCEAVHPECRKPEPVATKQMLRWVEHLKRLSDDGQHMSIPGLSSGACWELAIELEQFIKNTAPTPRKPLTDEEMRECAQAMNAEPLAEGWPELIKFARAIERAHGIGEQHGS